KIQRLKNREGKAGKKVPRNGITVDRDVKLECHVQNRANANDSPPNSSPIISKPLYYPNLSFSTILIQKSGGGVSIPAMKMVNPASRLKQTQQGSPDKSKHIKQRMEYMRIQGQQQAARSAKDSGTGNETSSPVSEKPTSGRTSIPVLTSFGSRNSSISF
ncbi:hypothetical protein Chor_009089, partial [Crotalus horridus]